jgi:hypothetical protein
MTYMAIEMTHTSMEKLHPMIEIINPAIKMAPAVIGIVYSDVYCMTVTGRGRQGEALLPAVITFKELRLFQDCA